MEPQKIEEATEIVADDVRLLKAQTAKQSGILSDEFLEPYKSKVPPFGVLGFVTYKRTYARKIEKENRTEEWWETCRREIEGIYALGCRFTEAEAQEFYDDIFNLRCSFSGRAKWQLGTKTVKRIGAASLCNCWGIIADSPKAFVFALDVLMLGGGCGIGLGAEHVYKLPKVKRGVRVTRQDTNDADLIISDRREGWTDLLSRVLDAWFVNGKSFTYSTVCIRGKGTPIRSFGGESSGPEELVRGIDDICGVFRNRQGKSLRPIDCLDIINIIGRIVVSGNVRRSAIICLGDADDYLFLQAKNWSLNIPNWRSHSNNSVKCNDINILSESFWDSYKKDPATGQAKGECYGLINLKLARERGRALDTHREDLDAKVPNPCAEIILAPPDSTGEGESCNLVEIFLPRINSLDEFIRISKYCYRVAKTVAAMPYHWPETEKIVHKNMRLGLSVTGIADWLPVIGQEKAKVWLDTCYKALEVEDARYSKEQGFPESIKLTCVKPSGSLSLLPGVSPGVHPTHSEFYIRRIRFASSDPLINELRDRGYPIEPKMEFDGTPDHDTLVVSFPVKAPEGSICKKDMSAVDQLELVKFMNTYWADNAVSVTISYKEEELPAIREWLSKNYNDYIKSVSFLMSNDHGFKQAPYETITEEQYEEMAKAVRPIYSLTQADTGSDFDGQDLECSKGSCPVK